MTLPGDAAGLRDAASRAGVPEARTVTRSLRASPRHVHVLCVDDEPLVLEALTRQLGRHFHVSTAASGAAGLELLRRAGDVALIVSDMRMPQMDGAEFLARARELAPRAVRILLTGQADTRSAIAAINDGQVFRFLTKPCPPEELVAALTAALARYRMSVIEDLLMEQTLRTADATEPAEMLREVFRTVCELYGPRYAGLGLQEQADGPCTFALGHGLDAQVLQTAAAPLLAQAMREGAPLRLKADPAAGTLPGLPAGHPSVRQILATRLACGERICGWLYLADLPRGADFGREDEALIARAAAGCAALCENARLRDAVRHSAAELSRATASRHDAEARAGRLRRTQQLLGGIHAAASRSGAPEDLIAELCRALTGTGAYRLAWGALLAHGELRAVASECQAMALPAALQLSANDGALFRVLVERQPRFSGVAEDDAAFAPFREAARACGAAAMAVVPLMAEDAVGGALVLFAASAESFDADERQLLHEVAVEAAHALGHVARSEQLAILSHYDPVTRLPNRRLFGERAADVLAAARRDGGTLAMIKIELSHFGGIRDIWGATAADECLRIVAARLRDAGSEPDCVAHLEPECFVLLLRGVAHDRLADIVRRRIVDVVQAPMTLGGREVSVQARAGVAVFTGDAADADSLMSNAAIALRLAKTGNEPCALYTPEIGTALTRRTMIAAKLRHALDHDQFRLYYQAKVDLVTGRICGCEALLRWESPDLGVVPPLQFIGLLEESGLINEVGSWVMRHAAEQHAHWEAAGLPMAPIAVNVSPLQLRDPGFADVARVCAFVDDARSARIALEITESVLMADPRGCMAKLHKLRALGIGISIDDFGTGYSALSYLADLPATSLKIDRSFVLRMCESTDTMAVVSGVVALARALGLKVIAEGVDAAEQLSSLRRLGCDEYQGYLFSEPLPADQYEQLLQTRSASP